MDPFVNLEAKAMKSDGNINVSYYDEPAGLYIKRARKEDSGRYWKILEVYC